MLFATPIEKVSRIGPQYQKRLSRLKIKTVGQLIFHFPHRYEDFSNITTIAQAEMNKPICLQGEITSIKNIRTFRKRMYLTEAELKDNSGKIKVVWFNQPYLINTLKKGDLVLLTGKIVSKNGKKYLSSPAYEKIIDKANFDPTHTGRIIPVYPETEGVSSRWLRFIIKPLLTKIRNQIPETLPIEILEKEKLLPIREAIWQIHFPDDFNKVAAAKQRFVFEELFNLALLVLWEKLKLAKEKALSIPTNLTEIKNFLNALPFQLTDDQKKALWQILKDLEKPQPMNRLLNGDVGSGKTVVATIAALNTISAGFQAAFMAPTEILAKQHFKTLQNFLKPWGIKIALMTGKENFLNDQKLKRKEILEKIKTGEVNLILGTHALIQEEVDFKKLGLVIIDEQHRFGIEQRAKLCRKQNFTPHLLSMSATPIPRTLALTIYGDLDLSLIKELPAGRKQIITRIVPPEERQATYEFIRQEVKKGRQVFVICPRIEPSKKKDNEEQGLFLSELTDEKKLVWAEIKAVKNEYEKLAKDIFPDLRVGMLHGKMKTTEKEEILNKFKNREIDILVATSVVEVGIDFPNATIMMIEDADKFGLAQLHQFRGRVGRGDQQSYCFLFSEFIYNPRLRAMTLYQDGFTLAEKDLKLRGPGDLTGLRQWGVPDLVMASLLTDLELVERARQRAKEILAKDPNLKNYPSLREKLKEFQQRIHLE